MTQARYTRIPIAADDLLLTVGCVQASGGVEKDVLESYCWMYSTWSIPTKYKGVCSAHGVSHIWVPLTSSDTYRILSLPVVSGESFIAVLCGGMICVT